jgi:hypothetical protein
VCSRAPRDPIQRYISSFHSKFACCYDEDAESDPKTSCAQDPHDARLIVPGLLALAGMPPLPKEGPVCLSFLHFVRALSSVHEMSKEHELNNHVQPQHIQCGYTRKQGVSLVGDLSLAISVMNGAKNFGFHGVMEEEHMHRTGKKAELALFEKQWPDSNINDNGSSYYCKAEKATVLAVKQLCKLTSREYQIFGWKQPSACETREADPNDFRSCRELSQRKANAGQ